MVLKQIHFPAARKQASCMWMYLGKSPLSFLLVFYFRLQFIILNLWIQYLESALIPLPPFHLRGISHLSLQHLPYFCSQKCLGNCSAKEIKEIPGFNKISLLLFKMYTVSLFKSCQDFSNKASCLCAEHHSQKGVGLAQLSPILRSQGRRMSVPIPQATIATAECLS